MNIHRLYIARFFGDPGCIRGPRKNSRAKAAGRRAVKKAARRLERNEEGRGEGGKRHQHATADNRFARIK